LCELASNVGRLLIDSGAALIELNPVIVSSGEAIAADAVIVKQPTFTAGVDADEAGP
jgi:succinyl-CoA synthetase beta subunit